MNSTKKCHRCKRELPATHEYFYRGLREKDGLQSQCRECQIAQRRQREAEHIANEKSSELLNTITCQICGLECRSQITHTHLKTAHGMTTAEYRALGYETLSPARLAQLLNTPVAKQQTKRLYGSAHPNWKGGHIGGNGYRVVSRAGKKNLFEHRVVAEQMIGRPLEPGEVVHHKDGNRLNNSPDNLEVMTKREHDKLQRTGRTRFQIFDETLEAARLLASLGWPQAKIARALRVDPSAVHNWITSSS